MPIYQSTLFDLGRTIAQFDFLLSAQVIETGDHPHVCAICLEPFDNSLWHLNSDAPVNRPVKLECGHVIGMQCLAHLFFMSDFSNRCPLCRAKVIPDFYERSQSSQSWKAAVWLLRILTKFGGEEAAAFPKKKALFVLQSGLLREELTGAELKSRIMVLYEELLNRFCDASQPPDRLAISEARVRELQNLMIRTRQHDRVLEESRASEARLQRTQISELKEELAVIEKDRKKLIKELQSVRMEERAMFFELKDLKEDQKKGIIKQAAPEKELKETQEKLNTYKKDLEKSRNLVWELRILLTQRLKTSAIDPLASSNLEKEAELEAAKRDLADAAAKLEETQRHLNTKMEASEKSLLLAWALVTLGATTVVVLVHLGGHLSELSLVSTPIIGLVLLQLIVNCFRVETRSWFWSVPGLIIFCWAMGLVALLQMAPSVV